MALEQGVVGYLDQDDLMDLVRRQKRIVGAYYGSGFVIRRASDSAEAHKPLVKVAGLDRVFHRLRCWLSGGGATAAATSTNSP